MFMPLLGMVANLRVDLRMRGVETYFVIQAFMNKETCWIRGSRSGEYE
jgi:hypothetical protein